MLKVGFMLENDKLKEKQTIESEFTTIPTPNVNCDPALYHAVPTIKALNSYQASEMFLEIDHLLVLWEQPAHRQSNYM